MLEGNVDAAVGVFDVEDHGVAADFAPAANDAESVVAGGHDAGEVDGADFEIFGDGDGLSTMGAGRMPGMVICSPALRMLAFRLLLVSRMASASSEDVK